MKYDYAIKTVELFGEKEFRFCLAEELIPVTRFLNVDVGSEDTAKYYISEINKVLTHEAEPKTISGNGSYCRIKRGFVEIQDMFFDNETVTIETTELIELIEAFVLEKKKFIDAQNSDKK
jgi:hypothetical protein